MGTYEKFSILYDQLMDDFDYNKWGKYINDIIANKGLKGKNILEMACGTGNLTKELLRTGYFVDGFDSSEEMLALAGNKLRKYKGLRLFNMDMRNFKMDKNYDAVLAICDSINYILDERDIEKTFANVYRHLKPGGIFIFDLNSEHKLRNILGNNIFLEDREHVFYTWENQLDEETGIVDFILTFFVTDDGLNYKRFDEVHQERAYRTEDIKELLLKAGFQNIEAYEAFSFESFSNESERINYVATKL
jgi:ubiquinone/menaquinone biosynthesis C-methylase UbiE